MKKKMEKDEYFTNHLVNLSEKNNEEKIVHIYFAVKFPMTYNFYTYENIDFLNWYLGIDPPIYEVLANALFQFPIAIFLYTCIVLNIQECERLVVPPPTFFRDRYEWNYLYILEDSIF